MPPSVTLTHSWSTVYLFAAFPLRRDWLLGVIADALVSSRARAREVATNQKRAANGGDESHLARAREVATR